MDQILNNSQACLRIIQALKAGRAPHEGVRFLSVGVEGLVERLRKLFGQVVEGKPQMLWLTGNYGEGKSHLLRLITTLAQENNLAIAYVTHDRDQLVGLHKPARLLHRVLWELQWEYPELDLSEFDYFMNSPPVQDRWVRSYLPKALKDLTDNLCRRRFAGLVICIDEMENCCQFYWNQHYPAVETLHNLLHNSYGPVAFCLGLTTSGLERLRFLWNCYIGSHAAVLLDEIRSRAIAAPVLRREHTVPLTERIFRLHAGAFEWEPPLSVQETAEQAWQAAQNTTTGQWRVFVQSVVTQLEIAHQKTGAHRPLAQQLVIPVQSYSPAPAPKPAKRKPTPAPEPIPVRIPQPEHLTEVPAPGPIPAPTPQPAHPTEVPGPGPIPVPALPAHPTRAPTPEPIPAPALQPAHPAEISKPEPIPAPASQPAHPTEVPTTEPVPVSASESAPYTEAPTPEAISATASQPPSLAQELSQELSSTAAPMKVSRPRAIQIGDRVIIARGVLRGWYGTVVRTRGKEAEVALEGIRIIHLWYPFSSLKRLKKRKT